MFLRNWVVLTFFSSLELMFFFHLKLKVQERNRGHLHLEVNLPKTRTRKAETRVALPNAAPAARSLRLAAKKAAGVSGDHYLILHKMKTWFSVAVWYDVVHVCYDHILLGKTYMYTIISISYIFYTI